MKKKIKKTFICQLCGEVGELEKAGLVFCSKCRKTYKGFSSAREKYYREKFKKDRENYIASFNFETINLVVSGSEGARLNINFSTGWGHKKIPTKEHLHNCVLELKDFRKKFSNDIKKLQKEIMKN